jgi:hypothetical protein
VIKFCQGCFEKQRRIDELTEEVARLKAKLGYLKRVRRKKDILAPLRHHLKCLIRQML